MVSSHPHVPCALEDVVKRSPMVFFSAALLVALAVAGTGWHHYFAAPPLESLPMPGHLLPAQSPEGRKLIEGNEYVADYASLRTHFVGQARRAFCGVASAVTVLNAMREGAARMDQSNFFSEAARQVKSPWEVSLSGMSLNDLARFLRAHGAQATVVHASDTDLESFRNLARENLRTPGDYLLINYQRAGLGQVEGGHISPVAAYDPQTDRFLILDVAPNRYPPVWAPATLVWEAMRQPLNPSTGTTRGFLVVHRDPTGLAG